MEQRGLANPRGVREEKMTDAFADLFERQGSAPARQSMREVPEKSSTGTMRMAGKALLDLLMKGPVYRGAATAIKGGSPADIALNAGSLATAIPNSLSQLITGQGLGDNFQDGMSMVERLNRESGYPGDSLRFPPMHF